MAPPRTVIVSAELSSTWPESLQRELCRSGWEVGEAQIWKRSEYFGRSWFELRIWRGRASLVIFTFRHNFEQDAVGIIKQHYWKWRHPKLYSEELRLEVEVEELLVRLGGTPDCRVAGEGPQRTG